MVRDQHGRGRCELCGAALPEHRVETDAGLAFCCEGCREIHRELDSDERADGDVQPREREKVDRNGSPDEVGARTFLRVDGMHCATCEAFLEAVAEAREGVVDAEASYVTETVRVDHDPDRITESDLRDVLSRAGYTAYLREEATGTDEGSTGPTRRSREMTGVRKRRTNDLLEGRYVAGVVFGAMVLLQYVTILYPLSLRYVYDEAVLRLFEQALASAARWPFFIGLFALTGFVFYFSGMPLLRGAYVSLKMRRPNTDLIVVLTLASAYAYSTMAALRGRVDVYYDLTIAIIVVVTAATYYESSIKRRATDLLSELTIAEVDRARRYEGDGTPTRVAVEDLEPGDRVLVREGERIPVDGVLSDGECTVDEAVVTGESLPTPKREGDDVVGGSVVADGAAVVRIGESATSSIDRLTTVVWNLQSADHGIQRRADGVAATVVPAVAVLAALVGGAHLVVGNGGTASLMAALLAVVVACPWALGLATPLSVASSLREAMDRGIVVFDETVFERLREIDVAVFDKTGTLTTGEMDVLAAEAPDDLLEAAAALERRSSHPAARAIVSAFADATEGGSTRADGGVADRDRRVDDVRSHATGIEGSVNGTSILVGHPDLFAERGWSIPDEIGARVAEVAGFGRLPVVVGRDGEAEGIVVVGDEPREGWDETVAGLSERGIETVVLTGDDEEATDFFSRHPHVDHVFAGVPPEGKTAAVRRLKGGDRVAMVGDGTNDAPALAEADLGIALGSGTALASDAADIAIVGDLSTVETAFDLAIAARTRVERNVGLALVYNAIAVPVAIGGVLNPLSAILAMATSSLLIAANSSRNLIDED